MISNRFASLALACSFACITLTAGPALAQDSARMEALQRRLEEQQRAMEQQRRMLEELQAEMQRLKQASEQNARQAEEAQKVAQQTAQRAEEQQKFAKDVQVDLFGITLGTPTDTKEDPRFKLSANGQVNRQVFYGIDSNNKKVYHTDSDNWPTLLNLTAQAKISDDLTVGAVVEAAFQDNRPLSVNQNNERSGFDFTSRFAEIIVDSKRFGKLSVGKGWASSFTLFEVDFTGTQPVSLLSAGNLAGGLLFYSNEIDDYTDINVAQVFFDAEQASLVNRVRYDSPQFHGFQISGSTGADQRSDVTLRWKDAIGDFLFSGAVSYQDNTFTVADWRVDAGLGAMHRPTGLSLFLGADRSEDKGDGRHADGFVVKAGWRKKWFDFGETKMSADFTRLWDFAENKEDGRSFGAFVVQDIDNWAMQLYGGYRYYNVDRTTINLESLHVPVIGTRKWF